jgi:hypothetical protein
MNVNTMLDGHPIEVASHTDKLLSVGSSDPVKVIWTSGSVPEDVKLNPEKV